MKTVGFVGWRGMVGSVLLERMRAENDFAYMAEKAIDFVFFTTSQAGIPSPDIGVTMDVLQDAYNIDLLSQMDIIISCQGGGYTQTVYEPLRKKGWNGYWIDAASTLRMDERSIIALDPINQDVMVQGLNNGIKNYIGGNCTVSLMLMAIGALLKHDMVEWVSSMTYQAASGAGSQGLRELLQQVGAIHNTVGKNMAYDADAMLLIDAQITEALRSDSLPTTTFGTALAGSLIPYIDSQLENGQSREEWKGFVETNKILGYRAEQQVLVDGICVRVGAMRCHSQALTIKLRQDVPMSDIESIIKASHQWVTVVPNQQQASIKQLTPAAVSGTLTIPVGRLRKMVMGSQYLSAFTVGDQLLWGAAEPLRRALRLIIG